MDIPWDDVRLFLAIAETGSLSGAARRLRVAQPTVSRRLVELEERVGDALFVRRTDGATPTPLGERLLEPARRMAEHAAELGRSAESVGAAPRGAVRISAPPGVAFDLLAPFARHAREKLPEVTLEVQSTVRYVDVARGEADLALRLARRPSRDVVVVASLPIAAAAFASREYASCVPRGARLADVGWIGWTPASADLPPSSLLARWIPDFRPVFACDDFLVQVRAAEAGVGAIILAGVRHRFASTAPELVELDVGLPPIRTTLDLVAAKSALAIPRVRAIADLLAEELAWARAHAVSKKKKKVAKR